MAGEYKLYMLYYIMVLVILRNQHQTSCLVETFRFETTKDACEINILFH
jgi:hypothetical protein